MLYLQAFKKTQEEFSFPGGELELLTEERYPDMLEALKTCFLNDEPCEKSLQMEWSSDVAALWMSALRSNLCINIVDENTKEIIGIRAIRVTKKSDEMDTSQVKDESVKKLIAFFEYTSEGTNLFEKY